MKLVVIESPYAGDIEKNTQYARECMRDSILRGEAPIASHLLYTQPGILNDSIPAERMLGMSMGLNWATQAELAAFYIDYGMSDGMRQAEEFYKRIGIPMTARGIYYGEPK